MDEGISSGSKDLKNRLTILEDECGLELSLGLSCGGGGPSSSSSSDKKKVSDSAGATTNSSEDARGQGFWLEAAKRKTVETGSGGLSQGQWTAPKAKMSGEPLKDEQLAAAWSQLSKQAGGGVLDPSKLAGFQTVGMNLAKYLSAKARSQQQQQNNGPEIIIQDEDQELEQQKRFYQQQEARKKRKMAIDEKKRDENGQDVPDTLGAGVAHQLQRAPSVGAFPAAAPSMAAFMRRTISDPVIPKEDISSTNGKDKVGTSAGVGATRESSNEPAAEAGQHNGTEETRNLASWQLGTTKDIPPAENINPELSTARPGSVPVGGTGSAADLPWVSTTANGKTINGVVYKMYQGQYKVVCACHGLHMSPTEFVKHAEHPEPVKEPAKVLGGGNETISMLSQVS